MLAFVSQVCHTAALGRIRSVCQNQLFICVMEYKLLDIYFVLILFLFLSKSKIISKTKLSKFESLMISPQYTKIQHKIQHTFLLEKWRDICWRNFNCKNVKFKLWKRLNNWLDVTTSAKKARVGIFNADTNYQVPGCAAQWWMYITRTA
jgi:hypothetical protein